MPREYHPVLAERKVKIIAVGVRSVFSEQDFSFINKRKRALVHQIDLESVSGILAELNPRADC